MKNYLYLFLNVTWSPSRKKALTFLHQHHFFSEYVLGSDAVPVVWNRRHYRRYDGISSTGDAEQETSRHIGRSRIPRKVRKLNPSACNALIQHSSYIFVFCNLNYVSNSQYPYTGTVTLRLLFAGIHCCQRVIVTSFLATGSGWPGRERVRPTIIVTSSLFNHIHTRVITSPPTSSSPSSFQTDSPEICADMELTNWQV